MFVYKEITKVYSVHITIFMKVKNKKPPKIKVLDGFYLLVFQKVESEGFEPSSKQSTSKLSTCLVRY